MNYDGTNSKIWFNSKVCYIPTSNLDEFTKGAGYIFSQVHNVEACVSGENLVAAFMAAKNYKRK